MSEMFSWSFKLQVTGGPTLLVSDTLEVDAYDKLVATVPKKADGGSATIAVQPGDGAEFLMIQSSSYEKLTFSVDGSGNAHTGNDYDLDGPHLLVGEGAVSLLGSTQQQFVFKNEATEAVTVTILVGRNAIS